MPLFRNALKTEERVVEVYAKPKHFPQDTPQEDRKRHLKVVTYSGVQSASMDAVDGGRAREALEELPSPPPEKKKKAA